jgi:hypothetical protein
MMSVVPLQKGMIHLSMKGHSLLTFDLAYHILSFLRT